jgi:hypothetical protein
LAALKFPNAPPRVGVDIQYVYYQFLYQIGVFISRSSISFVRLESLNFIFHTKRHLVAKHSSMHYFHLFIF